MSRAVRETAFFAAEPQRVWDVVMDPALLERWVTTHDSVAAPRQGAVVEGDRFTQRLRLAGKSFEVQWRVVEADAPRLARWDGAGPAGSTAQVTYGLAEENGGTRFTYENRFALPGGSLGKLAGGLLSAAPGSREARRSLERLRSVVEDEGRV